MKTHCAERGNSLHAAKNQSVCDPIMSKGTGCITFWITCYNAANIAPTMRGRADDEESKLCGGGTEGK